jgi:hypothetical protein
VTKIKPRDIKAFWKAPHCGEGSLDLDEECGFCARSQRECAEQLTDFFRNADDCQRKNYAYSMNGEGDLDGPGGCLCGGSGFWCTGCGRFWAQDSCGNLNGSAHKAADGNKLQRIGEKVLCVCGKLIMWEFDDG